MSKVVDAVVDEGRSVDNHSIGQRMKAARDFLRLTQEEMGKAVGASKRGIQENEARNRVPGADVVAGFVRLGINANWLLTGEGPMLLSDLVLIAPDEIHVVQKINVDALEAIIEGALRITPNGKPSQIAAFSARLYKDCIESGMITPDGVGPGKLDSAA